MSRACVVLVAAAVAFGAAFEARVGALGVEILQSIGGLPPHVVGLFEEPLAFQ